MNKIIYISLFLILALDVRSQSEYSNFGIGYSIAFLNLPEFEDMLKTINTSNTGLTKQFATDNQFQGFNIYWAFKRNKSLTTLQYTRLNNKYKAEGIIPVISPNASTYTIGSHHNLISFQYDYLFLKFLGIGAELGYHYSFFKNEQKDLFVGETNSVVDKQGGGFFGVNAILHIPIGTGLHFDIQPFFIQSFKKIDMDNLPFIYIGANHKQETKASLGGYGAHAKLGLTF